MVDPNTIIVFDLDSGTIQKRALHEFDLRQFKEDSRPRSKAHWLGIGPFPRRPKTNHARMTCLDPEISRNPQAVAFSSTSLLLSLQESKVGQIVVQEWAISLRCSACFAPFKLMEIGALWSMS